MQNLGLVNIYKCETCCHGTVTICLNRGLVAPGIPCSKCEKDFAHSKNFQVASMLREAKQEVLVITHGWFRPAPDAVPPAATEHILKGGLILSWLHLARPDHEMADADEPMDKWLADRYGASGARSQ